jgi:hypothetical protein
MSRVLALAFDQLKRLDPEPHHLVRALQWWCTGHALASADSEELMALADRMRVDAIALAEEFCG